MVGPLFMKESEDPKNMVMWDVSAKGIAVRAEI